MANSSREPSHHVVVAYRSEQPLRDALQQQVAAWWPGVIDLLEP